MAVRDFPGQVVPVVMVVCIHGNILRGPGAEQIEIRRIVADVLRLAVAADMLIETDNFICGRHDQVQIMRNHQYTAALIAADFTDQRIEFSLAGEIDALRGFVEDQ